MKIKFSDKLFLVIFIFLINYSVSFSESDGINLNLNVAGTCVVDNICGPGEDMFNCPQDCNPILPVNPTNNSSSGSIISDNNFYNLTVEVSYNNAIIKWKSIIPTMSNLKWGTSPDYKDGTVSNINFTLDHKIELTNLKEGTLYYFSIETETLLRKTNSIENQIFRTLSLLDTNPPGNPTHLDIFSSSDSVTLSWINPIDKDFDYIRVMKNTDRYHGSPSNGYLVYEGNGNYVTDSNVKENQKYFYSLFSRDKAGNYSSGSLISIIHNPHNKDTWGTELSPNEKVKEINDVIFTVVQNSSNYDFKLDSNLYLDGDAPIDIKTNYSSVDKNDDSWVEVRDHNKVILSQYFFYRLKDKDGFTKVTIPSFENSGLYYISIYRYANNQLDLINKGTFQINKANNQKTLYNYAYIIVGIVFIFVFILYLLVFTILPKIFNYKK